MAGLAAAHALGRAGCDAIVFEAADGPGGRAHRLESASFRHGGEDWTFALEHGIHGVWRQYRNLRRLLEQLGTATHLVDVGGQEFVAPSITGGYGAWDFASKVRGSSLPSALANLRMFAAGDFALQAARDEPWKWPSAAFALTHAFAYDARTDVGLYDDQSVADFMAAWPAYLQRLSAAITHSAFFREPEHVSLAAYFTGLQGYFVSDKRDTAFGAFASDISSGLLQPLCDGIAAAGGELRFAEPVVSVSIDAGVTKIVSKRVGTRRRTTKVDAVIVALDPRAFQTVAGDGPLRKAIGDAVIPEGIPSAVVRTWWTADLSPKRPKTGVFADASADNFFWLHRLQADFGRWHDATGGSVLECHLYGERAIEALTLDDSVLVARTKSIVERGWPELLGSLAYGHVQRNSPTHVAFGPGVMAKIPTVNTTLANVAMAGDWIACDVPILYLERATITGIQAAQRMAAHVGADAAAIEPILRNLPPARSIAAVRRGFRGMRRLGLLPNVMKKPRR